MTHRLPSCFLFSHTFCQSCIYQAVDSSPHCPIDRSPLTLTELEPAVKIINNMVNELLIHCPRADRGCDFTGQRQYMEHHHMENDCQYAYEPCQLQECQELVLKKDLHSHISTCKHRETECKMCKKKMPAFELEVTDDTNKRKIIRHSTHFVYIGSLQALSFGNHRVLSL